MGEEVKAQSFYMQLKVSCYQLKVDCYICKVFYESLMITTKKNIIDTQERKRKELKYTNTKNKSQRNKVRF